MRMQSEVRGCKFDLETVTRITVCRRCLVARRTDTLESVRKECLELGASNECIIIATADITSTTDLIKARDVVVRGKSSQNRLFAKLRSTVLKNGPALIPYTSSPVYLPLRRCSTSQASL